MKINNICFQSNNYLSQIIVFFEPFEISKLSMPNRRFKEWLYQNNNLVANAKFLYLIFDEFFGN